MAAKKKRPPKQVWIAFTVDRKESEAFPRKKDADQNMPYDGEVVGPYVLAERVRQK